MMQLSQALPVQLFNEAIKAVFPPDSTSEDQQEAPEWISAPLLRWYEVNQFETAINDNSTIMGYKAIALLIEYRDRINIKFQQYKLLKKTLDNPTLTSETSVANETGTNSTSSSTTTANNTTVNTYSEGMGGGDGANQQSIFKTTKDDTTLTENSTNKGTASNTETLTGKTTSTTTDVYMNLEGLKYDMDKIFSSLLEELSETLLVNIW